ncbi:MAG: hypothetical protein KC423_17525 [Anaerolineales bacterium]|nr:hypothetical protein [Anaerolineales bacterium]MCB9431742.1 hypothetical protein [Ardenticatenaceae bacterium]
MSSIKQIVIILLAALVVTGALYGYGQMSGAAAQNGRFGEFEQRGDFGGRGEFDAGRPPRGEGDRGLVPFNVRGILGFGQTLIPIALIIIVVALINKASSTSRRNPVKPAQE